jgi:hypothetical protein
MLRVATGQILFSTQLRLPAAAAVGSRRRRRRHQHETGWLAGLVVVVAGLIRQQAAQHLQAVKVLPVVILRQVLMVARVVVAQVP